MTVPAPQLIERLVNLLDPAADIFLNVSLEEALARLATGDTHQIRSIEGQFALVQKTGKVIRLARSIGRPLRYFIAKHHAGPILIVADRIDAIAGYLKQEGLLEQFHSSYTRMVPAHYLVELALVGCPDPNPSYRRYFTPERNLWSTDLDDIGRRYLGAVKEVLLKWLDKVPAREPLGVMFSGGIDSGSIFLMLHHCLLQRGDSPARLKAFTLDVGGQGTDVVQAREFLRSMNMEFFLEPVEVAPSAIDIDATLKVLEDYKPLDVQAAAMGLALCRGIRERYPEWKYLVDGDGGDENLKDYPIEENTELTIRSVLYNPLLYQEGWGVNAIKHSLTYSGGQSRGHVRSYAPARECGFSGFSPYALPSVIEVAEGIPFIELTDWQHEKLYALKGEIVHRGVKAITGVSMPVFEKQRFQKGTVSDEGFRQLFPQHPAEYRRRFERVMQANN